jgi:glycosyltransferase involved in cell wall biosynthesis
VQNNTNIHSSSGEPVGQPDPEVSHTADTSAPWPRISVVVPSYNQARFLSGCLQSIVSQSYPNLQLIVMDGRSTDNSVSIIKSFGAAIDHWESKPDGGQGAAVNAGMALADGDLVCWLNSDDLFAEGAFWHVAKAFMGHPDFGIYIGNGFRLNDETGALTPFAPKGLGFSREALEHGLDYIQQPSTFFLRRAWSEVGGLDETLHFGLDWDLIIRIARAYPVVLVNEFLSHSREYRATKTASGGLQRALELCEIGRRHTGQAVTAGGLTYLLWILHDGLVEARSQAVQDAVKKALSKAQGELGSIVGSKNGFPSKIDPGDVIHIPLAGRCPAVTPPDGSLPRIGVVVLGCNEDQLLTRTLESLVCQNYPNLDLVVIDQGSTDGSLSIFKQFENHLSHWESLPDRDSATAINYGIGLCEADIVTWVRSDLFADGALEAVGRTFSNSPDLEAVFGNALVIDSKDNAFAGSQGGGCRSYVCVTLDDVNRALGFSTVATPPPIIFVRKEVLRSYCALDETRKRLDGRTGTAVRAEKIERVLTLQRVKANG